MESELLKSILTELKSINTSVSELEEIKKSVSELGEIKKDIKDLKKSVNNIEYILSEGVFADISRLEKRIEALEQKAV